MRTTRVSLALHGDSARRARERSFSFCQTLPSYPSDSRIVSRPACISFVFEPLSAFQVRDGSSMPRQRNRIESNRGIVSKPVLRGLWKRVSAFVAGYDFAPLCITRSTQVMTSW